MSQDFSQLREEAKLRLMKVPCIPWALSNSSPGHWGAPLNTVAIFLESDKPALYEIGLAENQSWSAYAQPFTLDKSHLNPGLQFLYQLISFLLSTHIHTVPSQHLLCADFCRQALQTQELLGSKSLPCEALSVMGSMQWGKTLFNFSWGWNRSVFQKNGHELTCKEDWWDEEVMRREPLVWRWGAGTSKAFLGHRAVLRGAGAPVLGGKGDRYAEWCTGRHLVLQNILGKGSMFGCHLESHGLLSSETLEFGQWSYTFNDLLSMWL